jgi:Secretion system C-terminal sorting domain
MKTLRKILILSISVLLTQSAFSMVSPVGTTCAGSVALTPGTQQCADNNNVGSFPDGGGAPTNPCNSSYNDGEGWYSYVGTGNALQLDVSSLSATYSGLFVLDACPSSGPACIASYTSGFSTADFSVTTPALTLGVTYYIVMSNWSTPYSTQYCIDATIVIPPPPGACSDQTIASLPFNQAGMSTAGFGDDYSSTDACASSYMNGDEYIFDYTPASNETINITLTNTGTYVGIFVTDNCPDIGSCVGSATDFSGNPILSCVNLTAGITYFFTVSTYPAPQTTAFDIDIQVVGVSPPANDECGGAVNVTVNADLLCGVTTSATTTDATSSGIAACIGSGANDDVWFTFTATSTAHNFDILNITGTTTDMVLEIFSGTCPGSLSSAACSDPESSQFSGFTIGTTYFVRIYTYTATSCQSVDFDLCIGTPPPPPTNDEPCNALVLAVNAGSCSYQTGMLGTSTTVSVGMPAPGCGSLGPDVWYQFTVPASGQVIIDMSSNGGPADMDMAWYTSSTNNCNNLDGVIECDDADSQNGSMAMICHAGANCLIPGDCQQNGTLTPGQTVWVRLWEYGGTPFGGFDICAFDPGTPGAPSNCGNATVVATLPYSNSGATTCCRGNTYNATDGCLSAYQDGEDFMYEYTPAVNESIDITLTGTNSYTGLFVTDNCPSAGGVNCTGSATSTSGNPTLCGVALTAGTTYYIMVDTDPSPNCTPFNINITSSSTPTCGLDYTISNIGYAPDLNAGTNIALPTDDRFSSSYISFGFDFCFDGYEFSQGLISSNGYLIFDPISCASNMPTTNAAPGNTSGWSISAAIPNTNDAPRNSIMFPWQDIDPSVGGTIRYQTLGTAPNRRFVVTFDNVPYFSCNALLFTGQLKMFETTNMIEMHIGNKEDCSSWNSGAQIMGLHNYNGTIAVVDINYLTTGAYTNRARRFTYNCPGPCVSVLPVTLVSFDGKAYENNNLLEWSTATEINNDYFVLERSDDGKWFEEIATIDGSGNSNALLNYNYTHNNPNELEYYRLKQVDFDGQFKYSKIIAVNSKKEVSVNIYPNPSKNNLFFNLSKGVDDTYTIVYTNVLGGVYKETINISESNNIYQVKEFVNLTSGIYFIQIINGNDEVVKTQKIIKE